MEHEFTASSNFRSLLNATQCAVLLIDDQFQNLCVDRRAAAPPRGLNRLLPILDAARALGLPLLLSTPAPATRQVLWPALTERLPLTSLLLERHSPNAWLDPRFNAAVENGGRSKLIFCSLQIADCVVWPALCALEAGFDVYVIIDAGVTGKQRHGARRLAALRLLQAGAVLLTWQQALLELSSSVESVKHRRALSAIVSAYDRRQRRP